MTQFKEVKIPQGDLIQAKDGKLVVGDRPIVGKLRGDGIGLDIFPAMELVVDAAVRKAYGGKRQIGVGVVTDVDLAVQGLDGLAHVDLGLGHSKVGVANDLAQQKQAV